MKIKNLIVILLVVIVFSITLASAKHPEMKRRQISDSTGTINPSNPKAAMEIEKVRGIYNAMRRGNAPEYSQRINAIKKVSEKKEKQKTKKTYAKKPRTFGKANKRR